ncbi:MAG TPA: hypothetical protein VE987_18570 [Polyangiaceae bacterium]|nr:hypothetical protein [Polyangiaceae bacterium]
MSTSQNRVSLLAADQKMVDAVQKHLSQFASLPVGSQSVSPADIVKVFEDRLTAGKAAVAAEAARTAAVKANRDKRAQTAAFVSSFKRIVQGMFSQSPDTLAEFGLKAPKASKKTVAVKSAALAKNKATRTARSTMGSKQKKKVKGTTPSASTGSTSATTPSASPTTAAPAPIAAPAPTAPHS